MNKGRDFEEIKKELEKELKPSRYRHTLGVVESAGILAEKYGADTLKAQYAALLHDCAKSISDEEKIRLCRKYKLPVSDAELKNPSLLHAKCGAIYARHKYHIKDADILHAIYVHTTGCPDMSLLDKIIYTADYIEPGRDKAPNLDRIRRLALEDLDRAVYEIARDTLQYLKDTNTELDETTVAVYNYYKKLISKGEEK